MNNIKFIVKPEEGVIVGILTGNMENYLESMLDQMPLKLRQIASTALSMPDYLWSFEDINIKAIARCAKGDKFDETFGKKLVEAKIYKKLHNKIKMKLRRAWTDLQKTAKRLEDEEVVHGRKEYMIQKDLEEYFDVKG